MRQRHWLIGIAVLTLIALLIVCCWLLLRPRKVDLTSHGQVGTAFLEAIGDRDEEAAFALLSEDARNQVVTYCPQNSVIACFDALGLQDWGTLEGVWFYSGKTRTPAEYRAYALNFDIEDIMAVILTVDEGNRVVVYGWRGFVPNDSNLSEAEIYDIIMGTNPINQFLPLDE